MKEGFGFTGVPKASVVEKGSTEGIEKYEELLKLGPVPVTVLRTSGAVESGWFLIGLDKEGGKAVVMNAKNERKIGPITEFLAWQKLAKGDETVMVGNNEPTEQGLRRTA